MSGEARSSKARNGRRLGYALALACLAAGARPAHADPTCFPPATGVPGQPGLPDWWSGGAGFDDPRWVGSYGFSHGTVDFNALLETSGSTTYLVLRWEVQADPGAAVAGDQLFVGFDNITTNAGTILQLTRDATTTTANGPVGPGVMTATAFGRSGGASFWSNATFPSGIQTDARLDTTCDGSMVPPVCDRWAIRLRVPTTAAAGGIDLGTSFKMWYEVDVQHGDTGTTDVAKWPIGAATVDLTAIPPAFPEPAGSVSPPSAAWSDVTTGGGTCAAGVDLQHADISVANAIGAGTQIDVNSTNTFHVKPLNNTTTVFDPNSIKARLRIADWGSAVGDSPQWLVPDPTCQAATGSGPAGSIHAGGRFDLTCTWTLTAAQKCDYRPDLFPGCTPDALGPRDSHQCILADLSSSGAPVPFSSSSSWNNFNFDHSSKLERNARIDIGTLGPRDVYLYVRALNMPAVVPPENQGDGARLPPALQERLGKVGAIVPGRVTEKQAQQLEALVAAGRITYQEVAQIMPTYSVAVWHDSGTTVKTKSGPAKLLVPQPSFTLFVSHDGPLVGWKHALGGGPGVTVTEVARDFYRVAVGAQGHVDVVTSVQAVEQGPKPPWVMWLLALLFLALVAVILRLVRGH